MKYGEIEAALVRIFEVDAKCLGAFRARVRHLRNFAIPNIPNAGSGMHAQYSFLNGVEMAIALELQRLGTSPRYSALLAQAWSSEIVQKVAEHSTPVYLVLLPKHMNHLGANENNEVSLLEDLEGLLGSVEARQSMSIVNASQLVRGLCKHLKQQAFA